MLHVLQTWSAYSFDLCMIIGLFDGIFLSIKKQKKERKNKNKSLS